MQLQLLDDLVQLPLREVDLCRGALGVQQAGAHGDRDLVQVADLAENVIRRAAEAGEAALLGECAAVAEHQLLLREAVREGQHLVAAAPGEGATVGEAAVVPALVGEPESADVLDAVERDAARHVVASPVVIERRDVRLYGLVSHDRSRLGGGVSNATLQEVEQGRKEAKVLDQTARLS